MNPASAIRILSLSFIEDRILTVDYESTLREKVEEGSRQAAEDCARL
jgi:hypothetical protein